MFFNFNDFNSEIDNMPRFIITGIMCAVIIDVVLIHIFHINLNYRGAYSLPFVIGFSISYIIEMVIEASRLFSFGRKGSFEPDGTKSNSSNDDIPDTLTNTQCKILFLQKEQKIICRDKNALFRTT